MATLVYHYSVADTVPQSRDHHQASMSKDSNQQEQPTPFRGEFSFVNKDAGNIDSKDHNAAVSWHVMNRYERWKKQEQAKKLRASANVPVGPLSPPAQQHAQSASQSTRQSQGRSLHHPTGPISTPTPYGFDPWTAEPLQLGYPGLNSTQPSSSGLQTSSASTPSTHSSIMTDDPASLLGSINARLQLPENVFDSTVPPLSPLVNNLIGFAYEFYIPSIWPKEFDRVQHAWEVARSWDDTALIDQDTCYANAYLSLLAAAMATITEDDNLMYQSRYFQGHAMTDLRQRVASQGNQDIATLKAILKLFSSETLVDNTSTARMHLKMLRNLVNAAGGVILLDSWFREDLLSCDTYFALKYETRPLFPSQEWTPGPLSQPWKARLMAAGIYGDHSAAVDSLIEHPVMKAVITDLRELFKAHEYTQTHDVPSDDQVLRWQQLRRFDCVSRLADHHVNVSIYPHLFNRPLTQSYSCIATALLTNMVLGSPEPVRFGVKLIHDLRKKLTESEAEGEQGHFQRLRLWALYVGSLAEKVHPVGEEHVGWFEANYQRQAVAMGVAAWEDAKRVIRQFLYSDTLHREIAAGRAHRDSDLRQGVYAASGASWRLCLPVEGNLMGEREADTLTGAAPGQRRTADD